MKTTEQIKQEIVNYLIKTSNHIFIKPKATYKWSNDLNGHYVYDYNDFVYFRIFEKEGGFWIYESKKDLQKIDIDKFVNRWSNNSKCVIKDSLFTAKKMKSIKKSKRLLEFF